MDFCKHTVLGCKRDLSGDEQLDDEYVPPTKIDICDQTAVQHILDETAASYLVQELNLVEDYYSSNLKLKIMTFACSIALVAQFFPLNKFWFGRYLVGFCCAMYFIASSVLQLVYWYVDKDIVLTTLPDPKDDNIVIRLRTTLVRTESKYTIKIERVKDGIVQVVNEKTVDVGQFFTKQGEFYEGALDKILSSFFTEDYLKMAAQKREEAYKSKLE